MLKISLDTIDYTIEIIDGVKHLVLSPADSVKLSQGLDAEYYGWDLETNGAPIMDAPEPTEDIIAQFAAINFN